MKPIEALIAKGGIFPNYAGRSIAETVNTLLEASPDFQKAKAQIASEQNVRPGVARPR